MFLLVIASFFLCGILGDSIPTESSGLEQQFDRSKRIVGGHPTDIDKFPWMVSIQTYDIHLCSGSILSETIILTAAHCIDGYPPESLSIRVGSFRVDERGSKHTLDDFKLHEKRNLQRKTVWYNDVALIKVKPPMEWSRNVRSVRLPVAGDVIAPHTKVIIAGWGSAAEEGQFSKSLKYTNQRILNNTRCSRDYAQSDNYMDLHGLICAAAPNKDACTGDSGGPLMAGDVQVGIISSGIGCAKPEFPGVYTDVAFHLDWINENIKKLCPLPETTEKPSEISTSPTISNSILTAMVDAILRYHRMFGLPETTTEPPEVSTSSTFFRSLAVSIFNSLPRNPKVLA